MKKQDYKGKTPKSEVVSYNCNQRGHYSNECPEPKKNNSVNDAGTVDNVASKTKRNKNQQNQ